MDTIQTTINPLFWTLVHSLWQAAFLAMAAAFVLVLTKKTSVHLRYNLLVGLTAVFIITVAFTFYTQLHSYNTPVTVVHEANLKHHVNSNPVLVTTNMQQQRNGLFETVTGFLNKYSVFIMIVWMLVFMYKMVKSVSDLYFIAKIKRHNKDLVDLYWINRITELQQQLGIKRQVRVVESLLVKVPSVIGVFKPVILLPIGLLGHLPADQVEHIIIHELAHIKRKDYLFNLIQHFTENIFFFNPGVRWVSNLIKTEREHCCDDMAISITQNKTGFVQALVSYHEYQWQEVPFAMQFGAEKKPVLDRVKRIVFNNNKTLNNMEKTFLSLGVVLAIGLTYTFASQSHQSKEAIGSILTTKEAKIVPHTNPDSTQKAKTLSSKQIEEIKKNIDQAKAALKDIKVDSLNQKVLGELHESLAELMNLTQIASLSEEQKREIELAMVNMETEMELANEQIRQAELQMVTMEQEMKRANEEMRKADIEMKKADEEMRKAEIEMKKADEEMRKADIELKKADKELANLDEMEKELKKDFSSTDIKSFYLNEKEFFVNGKKQSNEMHKRYAKKYLKKSKSICSNCTIENGKVTMHD